MDAQIKVSVIIPIYNVGDYLHPCIESAINQTLREIEIILMDDGSTDESPGIIDHYAALDSRIIAIHKPNEGYGTSCNRGFDMARGEYVAILESDDFIEPTMYEDLYRRAKELDADVVKSPYRDCFSDGTMKPYPYNGFLTEHMPTDRLYSLAECPYQLATHQSVWAGIYRRTYMDEHHIRFEQVPGAGHVDIKFCEESLVYSKRLAWVDTMYYNYRVLRENSSTADYSVAENVTRYRTMQDFFMAFKPEFKAAAPYLVAREFVGAYRYFKKNSFTDEDFYRMRSLFMDFSDEDIRSAPIISTDEKEEAIFCKRHPGDALARLRPNVTMVVWDPQSTHGLAVMLESLQAQSMRKLEVFVLLAGKAKGALYDAVEENKGKLKLRVIAQCKGRWGEAFANVLERAHGRAFMFSRGVELWYISAIENLYVEMVIRGSDIVVGPSMHWRFYEKDVWEYGEEELTNVDPVDVSFLRYRGEADKIISAPLLRQVAPGTAARGVCSPWTMGIAALLQAQHVTQYHHRLYICEEPTFADVSLPSASDFDARLELCSQSFSYVREQAKSAFLGRYGEDGKEAGGDGYSLELLGRLQYVHATWEAECTALVSIFLRHRWMLSAAGYDRVLDLIGKCRQMLSPGTWQAIVELNPDLKLGEKNERWLILSKPQVTFIIAPDVPDKVANKHLKSLIMQDCPGFEVLIGRGAEGISKRYLGMPNVHDAQDAFTRLGWDGLLSEAAGKYLCILRDRMYWEAGGVAYLITKLDSDRIMFAEAFPRSKYRESNDTFAMSLIFNNEYCTVSYQTKYNALDCSPNNKILTTDVLRAQGPGFLQRALSNVQEFFTGMSYRRYRGARMICEEKEGAFLAQADGSVKRGYLIKYRMMRVKDGALGERTEKARQERQEQRALRRATSRRVRDQILFVSNRGNGRLSENLRPVYDALPGKKLIMAQELPHSRAYRAQLKTEMLRSRVIVTDDYLYELWTEPRVDLKPEQHVVQLWHAYGAFKKFGLDCYGMYSRRERYLHRFYDAVMVSSEDIRYIYAHAFGIPMGKVLAMGAPRADALVKGEGRDGAIARLLEHCPQAQGKRVILYCPTFRQNGRTVVEWDPCIDWASMSERLGDRAVLFVKKHPLDFSNLVHGEYENIIEVNEGSTLDFIALCDVLVTDYSSVIFDAALLDKPMVFFCPDFDTYERDFYVEFPDEVPGPFTTKAADAYDMIVAAIEQGAPNDEYLSFKRRYLSACDGHSTERIAGYIKGL